MTETLHFTSVAIGGRGVLIRGRSGSGKSDLALRLIDRGAVLVSDDYTELTAKDDRLISTPPATIAGRLEVRGVGVVSVDHVTDVPVALVVTLDESPERLPDAGRSRRIAGLDIPEVTVDARSASAAIKVELALKMLTGKA